MDNTPKNIRELENKIIARAWKDQKFKEKLMKNPKAAFKEMGFDIPEDMELKVIEDKPNSYTFVLPPSVAQTKELSEQELERIAAGCGHMSLGLGRPNFTATATC